MQISWSASHRLLGIAPHEQPPDHYRLLGLGRLELNADVIAYAAERQSDHLNRYSGGEDRVAASELQVAIDTARDCLLDHDSHRTYAGRLQGFDPESDELDAKSAWRSFADEFDEAWNRAQALEFDAQHLWLGIPRHQRPASNCQLLGLSEGEQDADVISCAAERQISLVRKFASGEKSAEANTLLQQLSRARSTLLRLASSGSLNHTPKPEPADPPLEILPPPPETEAEPWEGAAGCDPTWVTADLIDEPVPSDFASPTPAAVVADSQAVRVRKPPRKRTARFWLRTMIFALLIVSSHGLIGFFGYRLLLSDSATPSSAPMAEVDTRPGGEADDQTARGPVTSTGSQSPGGQSEPPGRVTPDPRRESTRRAEFAAAFSRANHPDPAKIDLAELDRADGLAHSISEQTAIRGIRNRLAQWETSREQNDTRSFVAQLLVLERQVDQLQQKAEAGTSAEADAPKALDLMEQISKLSATFPFHSDEAAGEASIVSQRAAELLRTITSVDRKQVAEPGNMTESATTPVLKATAANEKPQYAMTRTWTTTTGLSFEASISKLGRDQVLFRRANDGREGELPIEDLVADDRRTVLVSYFNEQDDEQFQGSQPLVERIASTPKDASDVLKDHHINFRDSPYGGLWAAVCLSEGENRHSEAARLLLQVIKRIEQQQQLDPNRHAMTLASACNNLAVCKIRDYDADAAAVQMVRALNSMPQPLPAVLHNALTLQKLGETPTPPWTLKTTLKNNLNDALKQHESYRDSLKIGWYYSLNVDLPARQDAANANSASRYLGQSSLTGHADPLLVPNGWCLACGGMGFNGCDYGNCVKGVITVKRRVQVGTNALTGDAIYGSKNFRDRCPNCRGAGGFDCRHCDHGRLR